MSGGNSSGDENKNVVNNNIALTSTDELIAVLSGDSIPTQAEPEQKPERIRIRIKKDYIRSYNDSLKQQEAKEKTETELQQQVIQEEQEIVNAPSEVSEPSSGRVTRRRGKAQEKIETAAPRISPIVSEFDSQSSVLGSVSSQATTGTSTSIINPSQGDCKVIHSRSSSVVTSDVDTSLQSSMAAAPRSGSENFSSNNGSQDEAPIIQKGRRGRKKQTPEIVKEIEMKPPEPIIVEKPATRTRNTRNNKAQQIRAESAEPITSPEVSPTKSDSSSPEKRSTRNTRNNNVHNVSLDVTEASTVSIPKSRKRKNPDPQPQPPIEEFDHHNSSISTGKLGF